MLSDEQLLVLGRCSNGMVPWGIGSTKKNYLDAARNIEAEVRKQDTELIQYLLDALTAPYDGAKLHALQTAAIEAARKRLRGT